MDEVKRIEKQILEAKEAYYFGEPILTDEEFDALEEKLRELDPENEVLQSVGAEMKGRVKVKLPEVMLSQEKALDIEQAETIMNRFVAGVDQGTGQLFKYIITPKFDGAGVSLTYEEGKLIQAISRGDWEYGTDLMPIIDELPCIMQEIDEETTLIVRGEIVMRKVDFLEVQKEQEKEGVQVYKSARNAAASLINPQSSGSNVKYRKKLCFIAYDLFSELGIHTVYNIGEKEITSYEQRLEELRRLGFSRAPYTAVSPRVGLKIAVVKEAKNYLNRVKDLPTECDGVVVRADSTKYSGALGRTQHHWKSSFALKGEPEKTIATVTGVEWSLSKIGTLTPVVLIDPVPVGGATVGRVNGHNLDQLELLNIAPGTRVEVVRSGGVIPKIVGSDKGEAAGLGPNAWKLEIPTKDPTSGSPTYVKELSDGGGKVLAVTIDESPYTGARKVENFLHEIGVLGLGKGLLEEFMVNNDLTTIKGFLHETIDNPTCFTDTISSRNISESYNKKLRDSVVAALDEVTTRAKILVAMGIPRSKSAVLENEAKFKLGGAEKEDFYEKYKEALNLIVMPGVAKEVLTWWEENYTDVKEVMELFTGIEDKEDSSGEESHDSAELPLTDKTVVITGTLTEPRKVFEQLVLSNGGKIGTSVSKNTDLVLYGKNPGSKYMKAEQLDVKLVNEEEFKELINL